MKSKTLNSRKMKRITFISILLALASGLAAQRKELPPDIRDSLFFRYPDATEITSKDRKDVYRIKFNNEGVKTTSFFDSNGKWIKSESILVKEHIPEKVKKTIIKKYPKGFFRSATLTETSQGYFIYEIAVETEKFTYYLELDKTGNIIKTNQIEKSSGPSNKSTKASDSPGNDDDENGG
jgi:hypothetical protein